MDNQYKATDPCDLERMVMDPNIAKSESGWWAHGEINSLQVLVKELERENKQLLVEINKDLATRDQQVAQAVKEIGVWARKSGYLEAELSDRDQQVAEACAMVCGALADCEENTDGYRAGADWSREAIRSGEWKKHMKGVE